MLLLVVSTFQSFPHFVYAGFAWSLIGLTVWNIFSAVRKVTKQASRMHQIPCATCQFFTGSYDLKCTVHPQIAMTEVAIDCSDYTFSKYPESNSQHSPLLKGASSNGTPLVSRSHGCSQ